MDEGDPTAAGWRPIATAPKDKDGPPVDLLYEHNDWEEDAKPGEPRWVHVRNCKWFPPDPYFDISCGEWKPITEENQLRGYAADGRHPPTRYRLAYWRPRGGPEL